MALGALPDCIKDQTSIQAVSGGTTENHWRPQMTARETAGQLILSCRFNFYVVTWGGSGAEWLARWTQAQKGLGSNRSRDAVG